MVLAAAGAAPGIAFERIVIDNDFPGGYQVEIADVNGDGRPDIIGVGGGTCAWYENPTWRKRVVTTPAQTPGIISSATADVDGDGKAEIAIAYEFSMNEPARGKLLLAIQGKRADDPWTVVPVVDVGAETLQNRSKEKPIAGVGSIHRLRWGYVLGKFRIAPGSVHLDKQLELVVAPIFGPSARAPAFDQDPARLVVFNPGKEPKSGRWTQTLIGRAPVLHAIDVLDMDGDGRGEILAASNLGVTHFAVALVAGAPVFPTQSLVPGATGKAPRKGASEVHFGRLKDGRRFLTTIEPWHGTEVCVYLSESLKPLEFGPRTVIDSSLKDGHALWVADVDGDGTDEVFAGYRGEGTSVLAFAYNGKTWDRTVVDHQIAAQDLRGGDLDGDGIPDIVAIGGQTHQVIWYRPKKGRGRSR
ncbi:MAG: VCBS repeat-containing protein [Isosphaeraceae bacterium]